MFGQPSSEVAEANFNLFYKNYINSRNSLTAAVSADENHLNTKRSVLVLYNKAIRELKQALAIKIEKCPTDKRTVMQNYREVLEKHLFLAEERAGVLTTTLRMNSTDQVPPRVIAGNNTQIKKSYSSPASTSTTSARQAIDRSTLIKNVNPKLAEDILTTIVDTSDIKMTDILGNNNAKQALEESVILPTLNPALFSGLRQPGKGILLFGPPGNGKTMLAKAVANESQCTFFNISAATIMSKWVGDGERLMQALFQVARNAQPSIIFIDEVDSMLSERTENENGAARRVKTEFLLQFDGCTTKAEDRVLVLAATNRPQELDDGVLRRFPRRIYIDLPDKITRAHLIRHNFQRTNTNMKINENELMSIAQACENYSFSDLSALCREAAMFPLKKLSRQQLQSAKANEISPVTYNDLLAATKLVRASSNLENIRRLKDYAKQFA